MSTNTCSNFSSSIMLWESGPYIYIMFVHSETILTCVKPQRTAINSTAVNYKFRHNCWVSRLFQFPVVPCSKYHKITLHTAKVYHKRT